MIRIAHHQRACRAQRGRCRIFRDTSCIMTNARAKRRNIVGARDRDRERLGCRVSHSVTGLEVQHHFLPLASSQVVVGRIGRIKAITAICVERQTRRHRAHCAVAQCEVVCVRRNQMTCDHATAFRRRVGGRHRHWCVVCTRHDIARSSNHTNTFSNWQHTQPAEIEVVRLRIHAF